MVRETCSGQTPKCATPAMISANIGGRQRTNRQQGGLDSDADMHRKVVAEVVAVGRQQPVLLRLRHSSGENMPAAVSDAPLPGAAEGQQEGSIRSSLHRREVSGRFTSSTVSRPQL